MLSSIYPLQSWLILLLACESTPLLEGVWRIEAVEERGHQNQNNGPRLPIQHFGGEIVAEGGEIWVGLWSSHYGTRGRVKAEPVQDEHALWLSFPLFTGVGEAKAELRMQGKEVLLPFGARRGEWEVSLQTIQGERLSDEERNQFQTQSDQHVATEKTYWKQGSFLLQTQDHTVGIVQFRGEDASVELMVFDAHWQTPFLVDSTRHNQGPDILLLFPVEPSLQEERGLLRINSISRQAVVPSGPVPAPSDRYLNLAPGELTEEDIQAALQRSTDDADFLESKVIEGLGPGLLRRVQKAKCHLNPEELAWWKGYNVEAKLSDSGSCYIHVRPEPEQHRRRFWGRIGESGIEHSLD